MKTVAVHDRPREKLERLGAAALGDNELLAIVIGHGFASASALDVANAMLAPTSCATTSSQGSEKKNPTTSGTSLKENE